MGGEIGLPFRIDGERTVGLVDRERRRTCRVDADSDDAIARERRIRVRFPQRAADRDAQAFDVVRWILPREMRLLRVEQHALVATGVLEDSARERSTIRCVHHDRTHRIRAVIHSDCERPLSHLALNRQLRNSATRNAQSTRNAQLAKLPSKEDKDENMETQPLGCSGFALWLLDLGALGAASWAFIGNWELGIAEL
jgi:hypothetical protein